MFKSAYETVSCKSYNLKQIRKEIEISRIRGDGVEPTRLFNDNKTIGNIFTITPDNDDVPTFNHPFTMEKDGGLVTYIDGRSFLKLDKKQGELIATNITEYTLLVNRAILTKAWLDNPNDLLSLGELPIIVFCRWLTEAITSKLGLGPNEQIQITTITLFYWYSLFAAEGTTFTEKEKLRMLNKLTQITSIPTSLSIKLIDNIDYMGDLNAYVDALKNNITSKRIENLNPAFIFSMLGGSWFGLNVKELLAVTLEHPPTFIAIIKSALDYNSYKKTTIGRLVHDNDKKNRGGMFNKSYQHLIEGHLD